ncbi:MAG: hypothetical protein QXN37_04355 [Candidatus Anstonellaceae archaeon]
MQKAFIFSVDAFVAFTLIMLTVSLLVFTVTSPKPYYYSLEQAHHLAYDTLQILSTATDNPSEGSYLEQILGGSADIHEVMLKIAGGDERGPNPLRPIIPKGFGYSLEVYNFADGRWRMLYDSGDNPAAIIKGCDLGSDRCGIRFSKLSASATSFGSVYLVPPHRGASPFCHLSCSGFGRSAGSPCNATPCDIPISSFLPGNHSITIVRFTVYA